MNTKTLEQLDYYRIRDRIASCCKSTEGKNSLMQREPFTDSSVIESWKKESMEWRKYLFSGKKNLITDWDEIQDTVQMLSIEGFVLNLEKAYSLYRMCKIASDVKQAFTEQEEDFPLITSLSSTITNTNEIINIILSVITDTGEMKDLPEIRAIRKSIQGVRREIELLIKSYTSNNNFKEILQSDVPTLRQDRQVLAIKTNFKGRIKGIVHELSQSGQTAYIEPDDVVQKNNDLIQEEYRLSHEIRRILKDLTDKLRDHKEEIETARLTLIHLDESLAAANYSISENGVFAQTIDRTELANNEDTTLSSLELIQARHPLLEKKAVPIDVKFSHGCRILVITGPNTGGKTVTLKTIALFALLNQSGFPVLAKEGTKLPIFEDFFADIGDEQSLDQSLSTFSGHMKNIGEMILHADENSLVLLDELGSGTDPQEGSAIAMSVLDSLIIKKSFVLLTTHHGILKNYGYTHKECTNASVEFEDSTLSPTYKILMGIPGESHALDIARKSGLPNYIVDIAQKYIENNQADVSALIKGLTQKTEELINKEKEFSIKEKQFLEKWRKVDLKELKVKQYELELREQGYNRSKKFLDENRKMLENLVRELKEGEVTREKTLKVKGTIENLTNAVKAEQDSLEEEQQKVKDFATNITLVHDENQNNYASLQETKKNSSNQISENEWKEGMSCVFGENKTKGILISKTKKDSWYVQSGSMKIAIKTSDISVTDNQQKHMAVSIEMVSDSVTENSVDKTSSSASSSRMNFNSTMLERPVFELRLLGMRQEEAIKKLERQMDLCAMHNFTNFSVIHGKGNGILQQAVHEYLSKNQMVSDFHFAKPEDGGTGKTYVTCSL